MSRIDEALRRARGEHDNDQGEVIDPDEAAFGTEAAPAVEASAPLAALRAPRPVTSTTPPVLERPPTPHLPAESGDAGVGASAPYLRAISGNEKLVGGGLPQVIVEEYRKLAASLHQAQVERGLQVLLVASAIPGEGKSLTAANLALTLSLSYAQRVLLVDADLRKPSLHTLFRLPATSGLTEGLSSEHEVRVSAVQLSPLLAILPAGRPVANPVPLLTSDRMRQLLDDARQHFDWVIIDTPPVGLLTDANLLTRAADASLLVVNAGRTQHALVDTAVEALGRAKIFGVVMNRLEQHNTLSGAGYSGYYRDYLPAER